MTDLSADLSLADSEARESRRRVTVDEVMRLADVYRWTPLDSATTAAAALLTAVEALARAALAPAVPQWVSVCRSGSLGEVVQEGMTLRDYFAARAMQAVATNPTGAESFTFDERAKWAYQQADAMLKARAA
jgi:hypothetical protein